ncbi:MAG: DUF4139 domain-containing protein [Planctomycetes bacterium]|nr:DUF4139 domain-containing protein [Planctomycetota bacterium]
MPTLDCKSVISHVTVYARGAVVTRRLELPPLPSEPCTLKLSGLSPYAQTGGMRTQADGERQIVGLTSRLAHTTPPAPVESDALTALRRELTRIEALHERAVWRRDRLSELALTSAVLTKKTDTNVAGRIGDALAVSALLFDLTSKLDGEIAALGVRMEQAQNAIEAAELALAQSSEATRTVREVEISLGPGPGHLRALEISYALPAARWWPAYSVRISDAGKHAEFGLEAFVAQSTLEDWSGVALSLCTADMAQDIRLPELASLRMGRAQPPKRRGYRPPPEGLDALFAGFDAAGGVISESRPKGALHAKSVPADEMRKLAGKRDEKFERMREEEGAGADAAPEAAEYEAMPATVAMAMEPPAPPRGAPQNAPMMQSRGPMKDLDDGILSAKSGAFGGPGGGGASFAPPPPPPQAPDTSEDWLDFDSLTLPAVTDRWRRGKLTPAHAQGLDYGAVSELESVQAHAIARDVRQTRGQFDHQFSAEGKAEIPGNGRAHRVFLLARDCACAMRFTSVACEDDRVFREAELHNPLQAPLLPGPVDVFVEGALLTTTELGATDRGGSLRVGLGVEERLRVVRNVRVSEESKGMLGGSTAVHHKVSVEVTSSLPAEVSVDVIERLPVSSDKEIQVAIDKAEPRPQEYDQKARGQIVRGGRLFALAIKPGAKAALNFDYTITLHADSELVGGNRRE